MTTGLTMTVIAVLVLAATACSNDDEPKATSGEEMVERIDEFLCSQEDNVYVNSTGNEYIATVDSKEDAHKFCESLIRKSWDGKNTTVTIPDGCGSISLADDSNNGAYYLLSFRNVGYLGSFTLRVASPEYLKGENLSTEQYFPARWTEKCPNCGHKWKTFAPGPYTCSKCGHKFD